MTDKTHRFEGLMIVTDLDGTFITPEYNIPAANIEAVKRFTEGGGIFTVATGRSIEAARRHVMNAGLKHPVIVTNGVLLYDYSKENIIWQSHIDRQCAMQCAKQIMDKFPQVGVEIHCGRELYMFRENEQLHSHISNEGIIPIQPERLEDTPNVWHKLLIGGKSSVLKEVSEYFDSLRLDTIQSVFTSTVYYELLPVNITKGSALKRLTSYMDIPVKNTIAIGDYYNDIELLSAAGVSAVAGGCPDDMKEYADIILCDCYEGTAADIVNRLENGLADKILNGSYKV